MCWVIVTADLGAWLQPDGPMNVPDGLRMELTTVLQRLQLLGFNALRLPFSFTDLYTLPPRNFTKHCTHATDAEVRLSPKAFPPQARNLLPESQNVTFKFDRSWTGSKLPSNHPSKCFTSFHSFFIQISSRFQACCMSPLP